MSCRSRLGPRPRTAHVLRRSFRVVALLPVGCALTHPLDDVRDEGGPDSGGVSAANPCGQPLVPTTGELRIDAFDEADIFLPGVAGRDGVWFAFPEGGAKLGFVSDAMGGYSAQVTGPGSGGAGVGLGVTLRARQQQALGACAYDVSSYAGITFTAESSSTLSVTFSLVTLAGEPSVLDRPCGAELDLDGAFSACRFYGWSFTADVASPAIQVRFQDLRASDEASIPSAWELERALALEWTATPAAPFDFVIDDVAFIQ